MKYLIVLLALSLSLISCATNNAVNSDWVIISRTLNPATMPDNPQQAAPNKSYTTCFQNTKTNQIICNSD